MSIQKKIVHVFEGGLGDYLRGSLLLAQYAKKNDIYFVMDFSRHPISNYLHLSSLNSALSGIEVEKITYSDDEKNDVKLDIRIKTFIRSNEETYLYLYTNLFYDQTIVTEDDKLYINQTIQFKDEYYEMAKCLSNMEKYKVLHIRCKDEYFFQSFHSDLLLQEIGKLGLEKNNTIVMSNNYNLKKKIHEIFGFYYIDGKSIHTRQVNNEKDLVWTIIDYIILSKSEYTYCFSYYEHGSGFSEQCSILHNIPYRVKILSSEKPKPKPKQNQNPFRKLRFF